MELELSKEYTFESSHILPRHKGKCARLHGHSWKLKVYVAGVVDEETGFVMDYGDISEHVKPLIGKLDHYHFGATSYQHGPPTSPWLPKDIYPSSENLIVWIASQLTDLPWSKLELNETCTSSCTLTRKEYDDRTVGLGRSRSEALQQP